eukprot:Sdes_comp20519_c0_seq1m15103
MTVTTFDEGKKSSLFGEKRLKDDLKDSVRKFPTDIFFDFLPSIGSKIMSVEDENQILDLVEEFFFSSDEFENSFKNFALENSSAFKDLPEDLDDAVAAEQRLEYHNVYNKFRELYEGLIENFLKSKGLSIDKFYETLQKCNQANHSRGFELSSILLATAEYSVFVQLMHHQVHHPKK